MEFLSISYYTFRIEQNVSVYILPQYQSSWFAIWISIVLISMNQDYQWPLFEQHLKDERAREKEGGMHTSPGSRNWCCVLSFLQTSGETEGLIFCSRLRVGHLTNASSTEFFKSLFFLFCCPRYIWGVGNTTPQSSACFDIFNDVVLICGGHKTRTTPEYELIGTSGKRRT